MKQATLIVAVCGLFVSAAQAGVLQKPNGEFPGGGEFATANNVRVRAFRATYASCGDPAGLTDALTAQNFNWTLGARLTGDFRLDQNTAWAENEPAQNFYGFNFAARNRPGMGGNAFAVGYVPGANDPAAADARWLQVIRTNSPLDWGLTHGVGLLADPGYTWYIDNGWPGQTSPPNDPFYGADDNVNRTGYAANGQGLIDSPSRDLQGGVWWEAWAFISTRDARGNLTIYDGVHWGFEMTAVPTPGSVALLAAGGLLAARRRRA
jgi:hypothetical protein